MEERAAAGFSAECPSESTLVMFYAKVLQPKMARHRHGDRTLLSKVSVAPVQPKTLGLSRR